MEHHLLPHAASHSGENASHELPNFITVLENLFPDADWAHFLHQWENIFFSIIAATIICFFAIRSAKKQKIIPEGIQNVTEIFVETFEGLATGILGKHGRKHLPFLATIFIYILLMNLSGLVPFFKSPTSAWSTTLAVAMAAMLYIQITGMKEQGFGHYLKHMAGNPQNMLGILLIPLMLSLNFILEIVAVPFSLSLRLFANISSEDRLLLKFAELNILFKGLPFLFQIFVNILAIVFSLVQAFVFTLLSAVYLSLTLPHENHPYEDVGEQTVAH